MQPYHSRLRRILYLLTAFVMVLFALPVVPVHVAEPLTAYAVPDNQNYRGYIEYTLPGAVGEGSTTAGILRQTVIYVYAKAGETICLGSDICDSVIYLDASGRETSDPAFRTHGQDIIIRRPDGQITTLDTILNGTGYIGTRAQEKAGPNYEGSDNTAGYIPHEYPVEQEGVYEIRFHSFSGDRMETTLSLCDENGPTAETAPHRTTYKDPTNASLASEKWENSSATVGAWDVTVVDKNEPNATQRIKHGRTYTNCLCLNIGSNSRNFSRDYYVVTTDGYIYRTEFEQIDPFGFVFFSNNRGLIDNARGTSSYHSYQTNTNDLAAFYTTQNASFHSPTSKDTETDKTFRIFFEEPDAELTEILYPKAYVPDEITDIDFIGSKQDNISYVEDGGYFRFRVSRATSATVTISFDQYNAANGTDFAPVYITDNAFPGENDFYWDGCDGNGIVIPEGVYYHGIEVSVTAHSGEYHFPLFDAETCNGCVSVERINRIYERVVDAYGNITDVDVTERFDDQRYNLYYDNSLSAIGRVYERNELVTDPASIRLLQRFSVGKLSRADANGDALVKLLPDLENPRVSAVRVFNLEQTLRNNAGLSEEEALQYLAAHLADNAQYTDVLYFDYYPTIADQLDCSDGINSAEFAALRYSERTGDYTAMDLWTYSLGAPARFVLTRPIIIEDIQGYRHANIRGRVFFDQNDSGYFEVAAGDYGLSGLRVTADYSYTESRWEPDYDAGGELCGFRSYDVRELLEEDGSTTLQVLRDYYLEPDGTEGEYLLLENGAYVYDAAGDPVRVILTEETQETEEQETITHYFAEIPVHLETTTDANGFYQFTGILMMEDSENLGELTIRTEHPSLHYNLTTGDVQTGLFGTYGVEEQTISLQTLYALSEETAAGTLFDVADVGYYYEEYEPPIILKKNWESDVSSDPSRPDQIVFHLIGVDVNSDKPAYAYSDAEILYREDVTISYYDNSWTKTMEHLPVRSGDCTLKYLIHHETFVKNGITYVYDGREYRDGYGNLISAEPYRSQMEPIVETYSGHILAISNRPLTKSIEITKRADNDRSKLVAGAYFKLERYHEDTGTWELVEENAVTNSFGLLSFRNVEVGKYRITEISAPDLYALVHPFIIEVTEDKQVFKQTVYEPLSEVRLSVTKNFAVPNGASNPLSIPNEILSYKIELSYDPDFTQVLPQVYEYSFKTTAMQQPKVLFQDVVVPNCDAVKDVYIRITEMGAGAYSLTASAAAFGTVRSYHYTAGTEELRVDNEAKSVVLKMQQSQNDDGYTSYSVTLTNRMEYAGNLRFQKRWFQSDTLADPVALQSGNVVKLKDGRETVEVLAVYAKLMRAVKDGDTLTDPEQVIYSLKGCSGTAYVRERYDSSVVDDDAFVKEHNCFTLKASAGWSKNCSMESYFYLSRYNAEGKEYRYYIEEVTNEYGNPYVVVKNVREPVALKDYKVMTSDRYTETFQTSANGTITGVRIEKDGQPSDNLAFAGDGKNPNINYQSNYYLLNYYAPELVLQITKNRLADEAEDPEQTEPLSDAEFTLYRDAGCTEPLDTLRTGEDGIGRFRVQLQVGAVYYLKETRAPTGYQIDERVRKIEYTEYVDQKKIVITVPGADGNDRTYEVPDADDDGMVNLTLTNTLNIRLPETGGGVTADTLRDRGIFLMAIAALAACIYLYRTKARPDKPLIMRKGEYL